MWNTVVCVDLGWWDGSRWAANFLCLKGTRIKICNALSLEFHSLMDLENSIHQCIFSFTPSKVHPLFSIFALSLSVGTLREPGVPTAFSMPSLPTGTRHSEEFKDPERLFTSQAANILESQTPVFRTIRGRLQEGFMLCGIACQKLRC